METAGARYLSTSCWRIRNRTSERSERVRFLMQKQRVRKYRTKHFPCGIVFIIYMLRHSSFWPPFYFKSFKNAKICRYTLTVKWQRKLSISFLVKTFVKNIKEINVTSQWYVFPRTHMPSERCFPHPGTHVTRDMCFLGKETHINKQISLWRHSDMYSSEHISVGNTYPQW